MTLSILTTKQRTIRIGIDINPQQLRFAIVVRQGLQWHALAGDVIDLHGDSTTAWEELATRCRPYSNTITLGLALSDVLIKHYQIAAEFSDEEINGYLRLQAQPLLALQQDELALDYEVINKDEKTLQIRMIATRKQLITQFMNSCRQVGLRVRAVDVSVLAISRLLPYVANLNIANSALVLFEKKHLIYCVQQNFFLLFMKQLDYNIQETRKLESLEDIKVKGIQIALTRAQQFYLSQQQQLPPHQMICAGILAETMLPQLQRLNSNLEMHALAFNGTKLQLNGSDKLVKQTPLLISSLGLSFW